MTTSTSNPYLRTKVMTASPTELRLMLFDGAIKFLKQGKDGLEKKDYEQSYSGITRCQNIIMELLTTLDPEQSPELCEKLSGLYTFMYTQLVKASTERDPEIANEVLGLLQYERETWVMLMDRLAEENIAGAAAASQIAEDATEAKPPNDSDAKSNPGDLVGGLVSLEG